MIWSLLLVFWNFRDYERGNRHLCRCGQNSQSSGKLLILFISSNHATKPNYENGFAEMKMVSIYIGNLTWWTSDYDLEEQIKKNGIADLVEIKIYENASNGQSKGYALVHLGSESSAKLLMDKFPKVA